MVLASSADQKAHLERLEHDREHTERGVVEAKRRTEELARENAELKKKLDVLALPGDQQKARMDELEAERASRASPCRRRVARWKSPARESTMLRKRCDVLSAALKQRR